MIALLEPYLVNRLRAAPRYLSGSPLGRHGEGHAEELIETGKAFHVAMVAELGNEAPGRMRLQALHKLRKPCLLGFEFQPRVCMAARSHASSMQRLMHCRLPDR